MVLFKTTLTGSAAVGFYSRRPAAVWAELPPQTAASWEELRLPCRSGRRFLAPSGSRSGSGCPGRRSPYTYSYMYTLTTFFLYER